MYYFLQLPIKVGNGINSFLEFSAYNKVGEAKDRSIKAF